MRLNRFQILLDARGADMDRWPAEDRADVQALLAQSEPARLALAEAVALDRALSDMTARPANRRLRSAILDIPEPHGGAAEPADARSAGNSRSQRVRGVSLGWTAIAASAAIGFATGLWWPSEPAIWQSEDLVALVYGMPDFAPELDEVLR